MIKLTLLMALATLAIVQCAPISKGRIKFKVSGRNFPDHDAGFGTTDAYFEMYLSTDGGVTKTKVIRSDTVSDQENPDWGKTIDFDFDRSKNQALQFKVYDEDNLREDDKVGRVWVNVADYVDKGQITYAKLDKDKGYLIIQSADKPAAVDSITPVGQLPFKSGTPDTETIRFKLAATNLPTKDDVGFIPGRSDPYIIITAMDGISGKARDVGRTATVSSTRNPVWGDVFTFNWSRQKDQRLKFKIWDEDTLSDEKLGTGYVEVNDFIAKGSYTLILPKRGTLTMTRA